MFYKKNKRGDSYDVIVGILLIFIELIGFVLWV